jgi:hypothetical protein
MNTNQVVFLSLSHTHHRNVAKYTKSSLYKFNSPAVFSSVCVLALTLTNVIMASPTNVDQQFSKAGNTFAAELYQVMRK